MTIQTTQQLSNTRMWWIAIVCGAASMIDSVVGVAHGIGLVIYQQAIGITSGQIGILSGCLTFGIATGALIGGRLGDRFGRRPVFQVTMILLVVGALGMILSTNFTIMLLSSILLGLASGADLPVSLATVSEAATGKNRGAMIGLSSVLWQFGIVSALIVSSLTGDLGITGARFMFGLIGGLGALVFIARFTIPESSNWSSASDDTSSAEGARTSGALKELLVTPYVKPLIVLCVFYSLVNLGTNTVGQFNTFVWVNVVGTTVEQSSRYALTILVLSMLMGFVFMRFVDTKYRMPMFYIGASAMLLGFLIPATAGFSTVTMFLGMLCITGVGTAFALEGPMKVWTQESFPTLLRSTAQGTVISVARYVAGFAGLMTPSLIINPGARAVYAGVAILVLIGFTTAILWFRKKRVNEFELGESGTGDEA